MGTYGKRDRILGNYMERGDWYRGRIDAVYPNSVGRIDGCTYDIVYDDGDTENGVDNKMLQPEKTKSRVSYQLREIVDVNNAKTGGNWARGMIRVLQKNGKYTVETQETGDVLVDVDSDDLRMWVHYFVGDKVEIKQCWWFKASIQKVLPDGRCECVMDDGYFANVIYPDIREIVAERYKSGDTVKLFIN